MKRVDLSLVNSGFPVNDPKKAKEIHDKAQILVMFAVKSVITNN